MSSRRIVQVVMVAGLLIMAWSNPGILHAQAGQAGGGRGGFGGGLGGGFGGGFGGGMGGGPVALLQRSDVQEELELLDDQKEQIREIAENVRERMTDLVRNRRGGDNNTAGGGADRIEELRETFRKVNEEIQDEIDKVLLPHQSKRLKQLDVQFRMRGGVMALGGGIAEQAGISEDQMTQLREKAQGLEEELRKKTAELRKQMNEKLLAELTAEQRQQINEMIGEPFEFRDEPPQFGERQGAGRGRGEENRAPDRRRRPNDQE